MAAAEAACRDPRNHRYTPTAGLPELREAIAAKTRRDSGLEVAASQVLVTNGGKQAVANAFAVLCDPGDEVLVPAPYWTTYPESIALAGGVPVVVPTDAAQRVPGDGGPARGGPDAPDQGAAVRVAVQPDRGRLPAGGDRGHRPVGGVPRASGWSPTRSTSTWSTAAPSTTRCRSLVPELADTCIVVNGVAKTYAMTGWRVGWMLGPSDVIAAATNLQSHETSNVANVSQRAALAAVSGDLSAVAMIREAFDRRRLTIHRMLNEIDGVECLLPEGAFYAFPSVDRPLRPDRPGPDVLDQRRAGRAGHRARPRWRSCPARPSASPGYFRMSYALGDDDLVEGVVRLAGLFAG